MACSDPINCGCSCMGWRLHTCWLTEGLVLQLIHEYTRTYLDCHSIVGLLSDENFELLTNNRWFSDLWSDNAHTVLCVPVHNGMVVCLLQRILQGRSQAHPSVSALSFLLIVHTFSVVVPYFIRCKIDKRLHCTHSKTVCRSVLHPYTVNFLTGCIVYRMDLNFRGTKLSQIENFRVFIFAGARPTIWY